MSCNVVIQKCQFSLCKIYFFLFRAENICSDFIFLLLCLNFFIIYYWLHELSGLYSVPQMITSCFYGPGRLSSICRFLSAHNYIRTCYFSSDCKKNHDVHQFVWITGSCNQKRNKKNDHKSSKLIHNQIQMFRCYKIVYLFVLYTLYEILSFRLILLRNSGNFTHHKQIQTIFDFS